MISVVISRFHTITTSYYRGAMGIMLVYDITNAKSFDNIAKWLRNIDEHANEDVERMILGNKCDMEDKRVVSKERGDAIAKEHNIKFLETSAKVTLALLNRSRCNVLLTADQHQHRAGIHPVGRGDPGQEQRAGEQAHSLPPASAGDRAQVSGLQSVTERKVTRSHVRRQ